MLYQITIDASHNHQQPPSIPPSLASSRTLVFTISIDAHSCTLRIGLNRTYYMLVVDVALAYWRRFDASFTKTMSGHWFTYDLVHHPISRFISECFVILFVVLLAYEIIYSLGIWLGLWEYHAKDIFTEVPVHCAHVYVRVNFAAAENLDKVREYYHIKKDSQYNILKWRNANDLGRLVFGLQQFVKYHFEFSPEDFENNPEPEFGSTVEHLRHKVWKTVHDSALYSEFKTNKEFSNDQVFLLNNKTHEVGQVHNKQYLSKIHIETGNVIEAIVLY